MLTIVVQYTINLCGVHQCFKSTIEIRSPWVSREFTLGVDEVALDVSVLLLFIIVPFESWLDETGKEFSLGGTEKKKLKDHLG